MTETDTPTTKPVVPLHKKRSVVITLIVCAVVVAVLALIFKTQTLAIFNQGKALLIKFFELIREAGPVAFFLAFALMPAFGVPLSLFTFTVAPTFAPQIGLGWVILWSALSLLFNIAFSYWLARYALRPVIERIVKKLGYKLPTATPDEHLALCILLRVVPGAPYAVQSYILGLAKVRFGVYMIVSFLGQLGWTLAAIFFGKALMEGGSGKTGFIALTLVIALVLATRMIRKRYANKKIETKE